MKNILCLLPYASLHLEKFIVYLRQTYNVDFYVRSTGTRYRKHITENDMPLESIAYSEMIRCYMSGRYDIIFTHGLFYAHTLFLCIGRSAPVYVLSEMMRPQPHRSLKYYFKKMIIRSIAKNNRLHILALGPLTIGNQYSQLAGKKIDVFQYGYFPKLELQQNTKDATTGPVKILFAGQLVQRKNITLILQAVEQSPYFKNGLAEMIIAGEGPLEEAVLQNSLVNFRGKLNKQELWDLMRNCDVLLLPSAYEGWGVVVNEAAAAGCALLLSNDVMAGRLFLDEGLTGFTVRCEVDSLCERIAYLVQHPEVLRDMKINAAKKSSTLMEQHDQLLSNYLNNATTGYPV